jgi:hypothetical protein
LLNCDLVQLSKPLGLRKVFLDEEGVQVFQIGEADELGDIGEVANVALVAGMGVSPLLGGDAEEGHVEDIRFGGVNQVDLAGSVSPCVNVAARIASPAYRGAGVPQKKYIDL